jgi:hypothetical protein
VDACLAGHVLESGSGRHGTPKLHLAPAVGVDPLRRVEHDRSRPQLFARR